jgi:FKBP-type peptidyl-prolyl cis-trans isomerase
MRRALSLCTFAGVLAAISIGACKSKRVPMPSRSAMPSASARAPAAVSAAPRKTLAQIKAPPLLPPEDALASVDGVKWKLLSAGSGDTLGATDSVQAELSVWTADGKRVFSTYERNGPMAFSAGLVQRGIYEELRKIKPGGKAWFWFSSEFVKADRQRRGGRSPFPEADLIMEYEPLSVSHREQTVVEIPMGASAPVPVNSPFPKPDAAGPPKTGFKTASGLSYIELRPGVGTRTPEPDSKLRLRLTVWPVTGLVVGSPAMKDHSTATTLAKAPAGLGQVLRKMKEGAAARVWLPAGIANQIVPIDKGQEAILDLTLEKIE